MLPSPQPSDERPCSRGIMNWASVETSQGTKAKRVGSLGSTILKTQLQLSFIAIGAVKENKTEIVAILTLKQS